MLRNFLLFTLCYLDIMERKSSVSRLKKFWYNSLQRKSNNLTIKLFRILESDPQSINTRIFRTYINDNTHACIIYIQNIFQNFIFCIHDTLLLSEKSFEFFSAWLSSLVPAVTPRLGNRFVKVFVLIKSKDPNFVILNYHSFDFVLYCRRK